jgi:quinol---cytochrome c reductase iron-sulfur subunit, bacillus type
MDRRTFLSRLTYLFSFLTATLISLPFFRFLFGFTSTGETNRWYKLVSLDSPELSEEVSRVRCTRVVRQGWQSRITEEIVWVRKKKDGSFIVFDTHCTHLGCAVSWESKDRKFHCPCHGGVYDADGNRIEGPPPRPLQRYETKIADGALQIGKLRNS